MRPQRERERERERERGGGGGDEEGRGQIYVLLLENRTRKRPNICPRYDHGRNLGNRSFLLLLFLDQQDFMRHGTSHGQNI